MAGIGLPSLLGIAFIVLKLTGVIAWSWFWVLSPLWIAAAFTVLVLLTIVVSVVVKDALRQKTIIRPRRRNND